ncbi:1-phosphofructokinase family hexose kinase [Inquilinus limosus]|uniref:1-phosphofructokinase family hexose kinase n=1 Tax=Inquilinus limosus TaxID=171674 RepID=UPI00040D7726|nr:1-phosphofructokinase family hexose kinase [Inquilinus limosus]
MKPIVCLTPNPALDVSTAVAELVDQHKMRCDPGIEQPGGGGINVARVIHRLGGDAIALYPAGGSYGERLSDLLDAERVPRQSVPITAPTRFSFIVRDRAGRRQYRFVLPGPTISDHEGTQILAQFDRLVSEGTIAVGSGSLPPGLPEDFYGRAARIATRQHARFVLDTSGAALAAALREGVYLVKPSLRELETVAGRALGSAEEAVAFSRELVARHAAEIVVVSLGADGAVLVTERTCRNHPAVQVAVGGTVGAGDSLVGGMLTAVARGWSVEDAFGYGMAAAGATLLAPGTALCDRATTDRLYASLAGSHPLDRQLCDARPKANPEASAETPGGSLES